METVSENRRDIRSARPIPRRRATRLRLETGWCSTPTRRVGAAELTYRLVEPRRLLEVADMTGVGDHDELRIGDRPLELPGDAERRTGVELAPDQQGRYGDPGQQVTLVGLSHHEELCSEARRAATSSSASEPFHRAYVSTRISVATRAGWWR